MTQSIHDIQTIQSKISDLNGEIVMYHPDETIRLEVRLGEDTVWLSQQQIAMLFGVKQPAISKHLNNIFRSGELSEASVYSILEYTASDGKRYQTKFYNLDAILSVGYRVNSILTEHLREETKNTPPISTRHNTFYYTRLHHSPVAPGLCPPQQGFVVSLTNPKTL